MRSYLSADEMDEFIETQHPQRSNQKQKNLKYPYNYKDVELVTKNISKEKLHPDSFNDKLGQHLNEFYRAFPGSIKE